MNYKTDTSHVCTNLNALLLLIPQIIPIFVNIFVKFCKHSDLSSAHNHIIQLHIPPIPMIFHWVMHLPHSHYTNSNGKTISHNNNNKLDKPYHFPFCDLRYIQSGKLTAYRQHQVSFMHYIPSFKGLRKTYNELRWHSRLF